MSIPLSPPSYTGFLWPTRACPPSRIVIGSAVFAQRTGVPYTAVSWPSTFSFSFGPKIHAPVFILCIFSYMHWRQVEPCELMYSVGLYIEKPRSAFLKKRPLKPSKA